MRRSNAEDFRARSAYKLLEVQKKYKLLKEGMVVVECGAAPGAWTQVCASDFLRIFFEMRIVSLLGSNKCSGTCRSSDGL